MRTNLKWLKAHLWLAREWTGTVGERHDKREQENLWEQWICSLHSFGTHTHTHSHNTVKPKYNSGAIKVAN